MDAKSDLISTLERRVREELGPLFDPTRPVTTAIAPDCIDLIGGMLAGKGGTLGVMPIDRYAAIVAQPRNDRQIVLFDFNEYDLQKPFTLQISIDALLKAPLENIQKNLAEPGRSFAEPIIVALLALHRLELIDFSEASFTGLSGATIRDPSVGGLPAIIAATHAMSQGAELDPHQIMRAVCDASTIASSRPATPLEIRSILKRAICWSAASHDLESPARAIVFPDDVRFVAIEVSPVGDESISRAIDAAAAIAHRLVLEKMRDFGKQAGRELISDPMNGLIGNLSMSDYKRFFRGSLPESIRGEAFIAQYGSDGIAIEPNRDYSPQLVADHLVIESNRAAELIRYLGEARTETDAFRHKLSLDKAGHLMYASHKSQRDNCGFGSEEADRLVDAVRANEYAGLFGGRLCTLGGKSYVCVLCRTGELVDRALASIKPVTDGANADSGIFAFARYSGKSKSF